VTDIAIVGEVVGVGSERAELRSGFRPTRIRALLGVPGGVVFAHQFRIRPKLERVDGVAHEEVLRVAVVDEDALVTGRVSWCEQAGHAGQDLDVLAGEQLKLRAGEVPCTPRMIVAWRNRSLSAE